MVGLYDILDNYYEYVKITDKISEDCKYLFIKLVATSISRFHAQNRYVLIALLTNEFINYTNNII